MVTNSDSWGQCTEPHPKTQQIHRQGHLIHAHIPALSNYKATGVETSSLQNSKHTKHTHTTQLYGTTHI